LPGDGPAEVERLIGAEGGRPATRLGLDPDTDAGELRAAAADARKRWQVRAESPLSDPVVADAARVVVRSCDGLLAALADSA
jgi:hypothetical protein